MSVFVDYVQVKIKAGRGGDGLVSFRREKFVDKGGPDGGDGGHGGSVLARASRNVNTLQNFRHKQLVIAADGQPGGPQRRHGKSGADLEITLPVGTQIKRGDQVVADLTKDGQEAVIARGGRGGFGNAHFINSTRQAPRVAEKGEPGGAYDGVFELKLLADVGLVGLPNAGKSTFLSVVSNARPKVADYPFTTLIPNLGVADVGGRSLLIADIPGLIAGASQGKGLGDAFLRHIERTSVILHLIDAYNEDVAEAYKTIQVELRDYHLDLTRKPQLIGLTKIDGLDDEIVNDQIKKLKPHLSRATTVCAVSSVTGEGIKPLLADLALIVSRTQAAKTKVKSKSRVKIVTYKAEPGEWSVIKYKNHWRVAGEKIEGFARRTNFDNEWGVRRLKDILKKTGVLKELTRRGALAGDKIGFKDVKDRLEY
ncbi:MAG TPA: GTPase ObgE [Candidatus Saccharimonadales bacterium]